MLEEQSKRLRRHKRIRAKIFGTAKTPRLCVFKSNKHIHAQLIDDEAGKTLLLVNDEGLKGKTKKERVTEKKEGEEKKEILRTGKIARAYEVGKLIAKTAQEKQIEKIIFDRGGYKYHGRIKALADGARDGGLKF